MWHAWWEETCIQGFVGGGILRKESLGRTRRRWDNNSEIGGEKWRRVAWIHVVEKREFGFRKMRQIS